jgi:hypothetical protein
MKFDKNEKTGYIEPKFEYDEIVDAYVACRGNAEKFKEELSNMSAKNVAEYMEKNNIDIKDSEKVFGDFDIQFEKSYNAAKYDIQNEGIYMKFKDSDPYMLLMDVHKDNFVKAVYNHGFMEGSSDKDYECYIKYTPTLACMNGRGEIVSVPDVAVVDKRGVEKPFTMDTMTEDSRGLFRIDDYFEPVKENDIPFGVRELELMESDYTLDDERLNAFNDPMGGYGFNDLYKLEVSEIEGIISKAQTVKNSLSEIGCDIEIDNRIVRISELEGNTSIEINSEYDYLEANSELYRITEYSGCDNIDSVAKELLETDLYTDVKKEGQEMETNGLRIHNIDL